MKRPAFQFYPADWRKDVELQSCSMAAQGLWINVMCVAHECEPYGHLTVNGRGMNVAQLGRQVGLSPKEAKTLLDELFDAGVARRTADGVIYSKRMVEDEDLRNRRAEGGKAGSEHGVKGAEHGKKGGRPPTSKGGSETPLSDDSKPPPSSSSSASTYSVPNGTAGEPAPPPSAKDRIFALGLPLLTAAGVVDRNARSMLGMLSKRHGEDAVADAIDRCAHAQPVEPVAWLQAALKAPDVPAGRSGTTPKVRDIFAANER